MKKIIILIGVLVICIVAVLIGCKFYNNGTFQNIFTSKPITIDKTENFIEEINKLAEFTTATYYQEITINKVKKRTLFNAELVIIVKGKVRAGFDMSALTEKDIIIENKTIRIKLPPVEILDVITNPSNFETFVESGKWSFDEVNEYKKEARESLEKSAIDGGILDLAKESGVEKLTSLFKNLGFAEVVIE